MILKDNFWIKRKLKLPPIFNSTKCQWRVRWHFLIKFHWAGGFCHWHQTKENDTNHDKLLEDVKLALSQNPHCCPAYLSTVRQASSHASGSGPQELTYWMAITIFSSTKTWPESCLISKWRHKMRQYILGELRQNIHWGQCLYVF